MRITQRFKDAKCQALSKMTVALSSPTSEDKAVIGTGAAAITAVAMTCQTMAADLVGSINGAAKTILAAIIGVSLTIFAVKAAIEVIKYALGDVQDAKLARKSILKVFVAFGILGSLGLIFAFVNNITAGGNGFLGI